MKNRLKYISLAVIVSLCIFVQVKNEKRCEKIYEKAMNTFLFRIKLCKLVDSFQCIQEASVLKEKEIKENYCSIPK